MDTCYPLILSLVLLQNEQLNEKLSMKENQLRSIKQQHNDEIFRLNNELLDLRKMYDEKLHEYEELLDLRVKLEQEILTLSALLREEEARYGREHVLHRIGIPDFFCVCLIHECMSKCVCILVCAYVHV